MLVVGTHLDSDDEANGGMEVPARSGISPSGLASLSSSDGDVPGASVHGTVVTAPDGDNELADPVKSVHWD